MKTINKIIALAFVMMMVALPLIAATENSSADGDVEYSGIEKSFDDMNGGSFKVSITGMEPSVEYYIAITNLNGNHIWKSAKVTADENGKASATLSWNFGGSGTYYTAIHVYDNLTDKNDMFDPDVGVKINSTHSIWKDWQTYVAIVVVVIIIALVVYFRYRGLPGSGKKQKPMAVTSADKPFTRLEEERKKAEGEKKMFFSAKKEEKAAEAAAPQQTQAPVAEQPQQQTSTEKQNYSPGRGFFKKRKE